MSIPVQDFYELKKEFIEDEGLRRRVYKCTAGKNTFGIGHNGDDKDLSDRAILVIFEDDLADAVADLDRLFPEWRNETEARKRALINLSFQLGYARFAGFKKFWLAMNSRDYPRAAGELRDSRWFEQTQPARTDRVIRQIAEG